MLLHKPIFQPFREPEACGFLYHKIIKERGKSKGNFHIRFKLIDMELRNYKGSFWIAKA